MPKDKKTTGSAREIRSVAIAAGIALLATLISAALFAFVMNLVEADEALAVPFSSAALAIGGLAGSYYLAHQKGSRGYVVGAAFGISFFLVVTIIAMILHFGSVGLNTVFRFVIITLASVIGGILGVNKGKNKQYI